MKRIAALFAISLSGFTGASAQNPNGSSAINIRMSDSSPIMIVLDGRQFKKHGPSLTIGNLPAGIHSLRVYYADPENSVTYGNYRPHPQLAYKGRINIEPGSMFYCTIDGARRTISASRMVEGSEQSYAISADAYVDNNNYNNAYRNDSNPPANTTDENNPPPANNSMNGLSNNEMNTLKTSVNEKIADVEKLNVIKEYLADKPFTTAQVSEMMDWLNFETTRLDLAKWGYDKAGDRENYAQLNNKFSYQNSKNELADLMAQGANSGNNTTYNNQVYSNNSGNSPKYNATNLLQPEQMRAFKSIVNSKVSDSDKLRLMEQYLDDKTLTTNQVSRMMNWLSFESSKLDIAKYCFIKVKDPENYPKLTNKLSMQSSKSDLEDFLYKK